MSMSKVRTENGERRRHSSEESELSMRSASTLSLHLVTLLPKDLGKLRPRRSDTATAIFPFKTLHPGDTIRTQTMSMISKCLS